MSNTYSDSDDDFYYREQIRQTKQDSLDHYQREQAWLEQIRQTKQDSLELYRREEKERFEKARQEEKQRQIRFLKEKEKQQELQLKEERARLERLVQENNKRNEKKVEMMTQVLEEQKEMFQIAYKEQEEKSKSAASETGNSILIYAWFEENKIEIQCNDLDRIENIKDIVADIKKVDLTGYKLIFNGREMTTGSLCSFGITNCSLVFVTDR